MKLQPAIFFNRDKSIKARRICILILLCVCCTGAYADSTHRYALKYKGIDVLLGPANYIFGGSAYKWLAPDFLPMEMRSHAAFDKASSDGGFLVVVKPSLQVILGTDRVHYRNPIFHKYEYSFGFTYGVSEDNIEVKNITMHNDFTSYPVSLQAAYTYREQLFHAGIKANSKAIKGVLAFYTGADLLFGITSFRSPEQNKLDNKYIEAERFNKTTSGLQLNAGIKYNVSCDVNIFGQYQYGFIYYSGAPYAIRYDGFSLGIRYKFIDEQDRSHYQDAGFW